MGDIGDIDRASLPEFGCGLREMSVKALGRPAFWYFDIPRCATVYKNFEILSEVKENNDTHENRTKPQKVRECSLKRRKAVRILEVGV